MNEIQMIRAQLTAERQHASTVANACATALGRRNAVALSSGPALEEFRQACVDYLVCVLAWFEERDQRLSAGIDADSILEERQRYARVSAALPGGASLAFPRRRGS